MQSLIDIFHKRGVMQVLKYIFRLNIRFGEYHTLDMLSDEKLLMNKCKNKRDEVLVKEFLNIWKK